MKFYSEKLNKVFDTVDELEAAELDAAEKEKTRLQAAEERKVDAAKVEEAFRAHNKARREYNEKIVSLRKEYNNALVEAKQAFDDALVEAAREKQLAEETYDSALKEFQAKYDSFHLSLKDGDNVMTVSSANLVQDNSKTTAHLCNEVNALLDTLLKIW